MGIPTFFISILKNKKYKNIHKGVNNPNCDYFFIDFNSIIYGSYQIIKKKLENRKQQLFLKNQKPKKYGD